MKRVIISLLIFICTWPVLAQEKVIVLDTTMFSGFQQIQLAPKKGWVFKKGHDLQWSDPNLNTQSWDTIKVTNLNADMADENGRLEGWLRIKIQLDSSFTDIPVHMMQKAWAATDLYVDGELIHSFGNTGIDGHPYKEYKRELMVTHPMPFEVDQEHVIAIHLVDHVVPLTNKIKSQVFTLPGFLNLTGPDYLLNSAIDKSSVVNLVRFGFGSGFTVLSLLFWLLYLQNRKEHHLLLIAITMTIFSIQLLVLDLYQNGNISFYHQGIYDIIGANFIVAISLIIPLTLGVILKGRIPNWHWALFFILIIVGLISIFKDSIIDWIRIVTVISSFFLCSYYIYNSRKSIHGAKKAPVIGLFITITGGILFLLILLIQNDLEDFPEFISVVIGLVIFLSFPLSLLVYVSLWFKQMFIDVTAKAKEVIRMTEEKKKILADQNVILDKQVRVRTSELNTSLENLKATQSQLIQSEKMASLGELTAGIAHEIQNPLNFVNNFSEVSKELMTEMKEELVSGDVKEAQEIGKDIEINLDKIHHHGKRASNIVKGMLDHSRTGKGEKKLTDINAMADEYLRLSYHGLRAKDRTFTADFEAELDETIPKISIVAQDFGRVILNLINNAFYAVSEKRKKSDKAYEPKVTVVTKKMEDTILISVKDNGNGIPKNLLNKIFQPFFTTKPTGEGTGLGLSLSYDIVKAHGGEITVQSKKGEGTEFIIQLPIKE